MAGIEDEEYMLTTVDNPYDPFTQYDEWYAYDFYAGYHSPEFLARIAVVADELSDADQRLAINQAIDEIVKENVLGLHKKVSRPANPKTAVSDIKV